MQSCLFALQKKLSRFVNPYLFLLTTVQGELSLVSVTSEKAYPHFFLNLQAWAVSMSLINFSRTIWAVLEVEWIDLLVVSISQFSNLFLSMSAD